MLQIQDQRMLQKKGLSGMTAYHCCHGQAAFIPYVEPVDQMMAEQLELILRALHTFHSGDQPEAFRLINQAIEIDKKLPYFPAPPLTVKPVHEVYGEMLILAGKPEEAIQQFDLALAKTPNRTRAVIGKYRAYMKLDNAAGAAEMKKIIKKNWGNADPDVLAGL
jgi:tetratricopeptide (TPR) repeat protein